MLRGLCPLSVASCGRATRAPAGTRARTEDTAVNITYVQGGAQEPQSGFWCRGGRGGRGGWSSRSSPRTVSAACCGRRHGGGLALVFCVSQRRLLDEFLSVFYASVDPDPEVDSPLAPAVWTLLLRAPLHLVVPCPVLRQSPEPFLKNFSVSAMPNRLTEQERLSVYNLEPRTSAWKRRSYRKANCGEVAHHHPARSNWIPRSRVPDESLPHDTQWRLCHLVQQRYFFPDIKVTSIYLHDLRHYQPDRVI